MKIPYKYAVALVVAIGLFMAVLDNTVINVALTAMQQSFNTDINTIQWVITAYFLSQAAVIPVAGYFGNRIGIKRLFIIALAVFTVGSLLCGLAEVLGGTASGAGLLVAFRVLQGIGGGMLFPLGTAIAFGAFPPAERAASSAFVAIPVLIAPTLGPTVGGLIVDSALGWPWIFFINIPVGIVAIALVARILRPDTVEAAGAGRGAGRAHAPFDYVGLILSMLGVTLVVYAFALVSQTEGGSATAANPRGQILGWDYWLVWTLLGAGLAVLSAFALYELRIARDPVLDLHLFTSYSFTVTTVMTWVVRAVVFGSFFLLPLFLQQVRGLSAVTTGLMLIPQGIGAAIGAGSGSRLYDRIGPRTLVMLGMIALTISSLLLVGVDTTSGWAFFTPILLLRGLGFGWSNLPLQTVALSAITGPALPKASSLYNATAQIFSSIGVAVLSTLFIQGTTDRIADQVSVARAAGTPPAADLVQQAGAGATGSVFLVVTIATALAALIGFLLPRQSLKQAEGGHAPGAPSTAPARAIPGD
ncbi:MAG: multidrug efflux MFS transporter [Chloroflexota bacterium]|nr:multidrug efflux MFS transporter [Chloroflexota bacterium]